MGAAFKAFRRFNQPELQFYAGLRGRIDMRAWDHFGDRNLPDKIVRAIAARRAVPIKEIFESFEFFERVRTRLRAPHVADMCCGHGLTGLLFAAFERSVEQVTLIDTRQPDSYAVLLKAFDEVAPWTSPKMRYIQTRVRQAPRHLDPGTAIVGVHACGVRTDRSINVAHALGGNVAVMPCCYARTADRLPRASRDALGAELATDIDRTYRMTSMGYRVEWSAIPEVITPMHRILVGVRPGAVPGWEELRFVRDVTPEIVEEIWGPRFGSPIVTPTGTYTPHDVEALLLTTSDGERAALITWVVEGDTAEIVSINAIPPGAGFGTRVLNAVTDELIGRSVRHLKLFTTEDNLRSLRFFRRHGFRLTDIHPDVMDAVRAAKPEVAELADDGLPLRDMWELRKTLKSPA